MLRRWVGVDHGGAVADPCWPQRTQERGNAKINARFEHSVPSFVPRLTPSSAPPERELWINRKYLEKAFHATRAGPLSVRCEKSEAPGARKLKGRWTKCWCRVLETSLEIFLESSEPKVRRSMASYSY